MGDERECGVSGVQVEASESKQSEGVELQMVAVRRRSPEGYALQQASQLSPNS